jgi:transcriptional regulator GlxA family with amidase domain
LKEAAHGKCPTARVLASGSPLSDRFNKLGSNCGGSDSSARLQLLQLFMDSFDWDTQQAPPEPAPWMDGRDRFRKMLNQMVASEFVELSVSDLAPMMACSPRHLNRLFREELGASFREKQIELRMTKACELLATSNAKVVEVALESGYQSSSVFSELFKRHFGVSPGQWRRQRVKTQSPARLQL